MPCSVYETLLFTIIYSYSICKIWVYEHMNIKEVILRWQYGWHWFHIYKSIEVSALKEAKSCLDAKEIIFYSKNGKIFLEIKIRKNKTGHCASWQFLNLSSDASSRRMKMIVSSAVKVRINILKNRIPLGGPGGGGELIRRLSEMFAAFSLYTPKILPCSQLSKSSLAQRKLPTLNFQSLK